MNKERQQTARGARIVTHIETYTMFCIGSVLVRISKS
jgi:hypothetical protein